MAKRNARAGHNREQQEDGKLNDSARRSDTTQQRLTQHLLKTLDHAQGAKNAAHWALTRTALKVWALESEEVLEECFDDLRVEIPRSPNRSGKSLATRCADLWQRLMEAQLKQIATDLGLNTHGGDATYELLRKQIAGPSWFDVHAVAETLEKPFEATIKIIEGLMRGRPIAQTTITLRRDQVRALHGVEKSRLALLKESRPWMIAALGDAPHIAPKASSQWAGWFAATAWGEDNSVNEDTVTLAAYSARRWKTPCVAPPLRALWAASKAGQHLKTDADWGAALIIEKSLGANAAEALETGQTVQAKARTIIAEANAGIEAHALGTIRVWTGVGQLKAKSLLEECRRRWKAEVPLKERALKLEAPGGWKAHYTNADRLIIGISQRGVSTFSRIKIGRRANDEMEYHSAIVIELATPGGVKMVRKVGRRQRTSQATTRLADVAARALKPLDPYMKEPYG